jgi:hypothetical protein
LRAPYAARVRSHQFTGGDQLIAGMRERRQDVVPLVGDFVLEVVTDGRVAVARSCSVSIA